MDSVIPFLFLLAWLGLIVCIVLLGTRLVNAVEEIALMADRLFNSSPRAE